MSIKYNNFKYKVKFKDWLIINMYKFVLVLKRVKRLCDRLIVYFKPTLLVLLIFLIYLIIVYKIGVRVANYETFWDALWDSKDVLFASIILVYGTTIFYGEKERKYKLRKQLQSVYLITDYSDYAIKNILESINIEYNDSAVLTTEKNDNFRNYLDSIDTKTAKINKNYNDTSLIELIQIIKDVSKDIKNSEYLMFGHYDDTIYKDLQKELQMFCNELKHNKFFTRELVDELSIISYHLLLACAFLRRIWRWDYNITQKIRFIIYKRGKACEDYGDLGQWF